MSTFSVKPFASKRLTWWNEQYHQEKLDMSPEYQRRSELWSPWKRAHLIDSILNDFDVPKFYVADFTSSKSALNIGRKPYAIIDGKQRFEAIFQFLADKLSLNATFELIADPAVKIAGMTYSQIKAKFPVLAAKVENFEPAVMSVVAHKKDMIEQLFIRLNSGVPATGAERRNAMPGPVPPMLRNLTLHPFFQSKIRFGTGRMQEFNLAAKLLFIEYKGSFVDTKAGNLDKFVLEAAKATAEQLVNYRKAEELVQNTLETLALAFEHRDSLLSAQGHIPVYYWIIRNKPEYRRPIRPFLETFTRQVRENLQISKIDPKKADTELLNYYTRGRTTNDQGSLQDRYYILLHRLQKFMKSNDGQKWK